MENDTVGACERNPRTEALENYLTQIMFLKVLVPSSLIL